MGISKYGVWAFFDTKEKAIKVGKELNSLMNSYGVFISDKLKVLEGNSLRFYLASKQTMFELTWRLPAKFVWIDECDGKDWKQDTASNDYWDEGEGKLKEMKELIKGKKRRPKPSQ